MREQEEPLPIREHKTKCVEIIENEDLNQIKNKIYIHTHTHLHHHIVCHLYNACKLIEVVEKWLTG